MSDGCSGQSGRSESRWHGISAGTELLDWFNRTGRITVAFSGGVDSSLVLAAAVRALGQANVHAVTAVSESLPSGMLSAARQLAAILRVRHTEIATREIDNPGYTANGADRCYFCKATLIDTVVSMGHTVAGGLLVTGTNADDVAGRLAARDQGRGRTWRWHSARGHRNDQG